MKRIAAILPMMLALQFLLTPSLLPAEDQEGCLLCHGLEGFGYVEKGSFKSLYVNAEEFSLSRHGQSGCRRCHRNILSIPHELPVQPVNCGLDCHAVQESSGKPYTHEALYWAFMGSVHGKGPGAGTACLACHPRDPSPADARQTPGTKVADCAACHLARTEGDSAAGGRRRIEAYLCDVHGRIVLAGGKKAPTCPDCHTQHAVLPSGQETAATNPNRVAGTCAGGILPAADRSSCHREASTARLAGMSPLGGGGWPSLPQGIIFWLSGMALCALLAVRLVLGLGRRRG